MRVNGLECACLARFCALLQARLGDGLVEVRLFGSAARGDMWPPNGRSRTSDS
jgi:predicted nucleotidyltransferase